MHDGFAILDAVHTPLVHADNQQPTIRQPAEPAGAVIGERVHYLASTVAVEAMTVCPSMSESHSAPWCQRGHRRSGTSRRTAGSGASGE